MAVHIKELIYRVRREGKTIAKVQTFDEENIYLRIYDTDVGVVIDRDLAGMIARRLHECLADTSANGKYGDKNRYGTANLARDITAPRFREDEEQ